MSWLSRGMICSGVCVDPFSPSGSCSPDKATRKGQKKVPPEEAPAEPPPAADTGPDADKVQDEESSDDDSSSDDER